MIFSRDNRFLKPSIYNLYQFVQRIQRLIREFFSSITNILEVKSLKYRQASFSSSIIYTSKNVQYNLINYSSNLSNVVKNLEIFTTLTRRRLQFSLFSTYVSLYFPSVTMLSTFNFRLFRRGAFIILKIEYFYLYFLLLFYLNNNLLYYYPSIFDTNVHVFAETQRHPFQPLCLRDSRNGIEAICGTRTNSNREPREDHSIFDLIFVIVVKTARASNSIVHRSLYMYIR